jgi:hypothetical protein
MTWARVLAGLILLGMLACMLVGCSVGSAVVHTVALGHRVVWDVVLDAPAGRAFLLAATLHGSDDTAAVQVLDLSTGAVRRTVVLGAGLPVTQALPDPWNWVPSGVRRWIPFLPPPRLRTRSVPASVRVLATTPQTRP